jgi:hypothetical protein
MSHHYLASDRPRRQSRASADAGRPRHDDALVPRPRHPPPPHSATTAGQFPFRLGAVRLIGVSLE